MQDDFSREELAFLARRAGLALSEKQMTELLVVGRQIRTMAARVRQPRGRQAEPAHVFVPGETTR